MRIPFSVPAQGSRAFDVVGLGENSVDLVAVVEEFPTPDSKQRLTHFARLPGGQIATALAVCARLGWRARYLGSFGDDPFGTLSRDSLLGHGVDVSAARLVARATSRLAIVLVEARSGERTVLWDRDPALEMTPAHVPGACAASGRLLMVDCQDTAASAQAARDARAAGVPTIIDVDAVGPGVEDALQSVDVVIAGRAFPTALTGHADLGRALECIGREFRARLVCVTLGSEGSLAWCGGREIRTAAFPIECVDGTGAGDAFRGGFAAACLRMPEGDIEDALLYANATAALSCRALGAQGSMPTADEVDRLLASRPTQ